MKCSIVSSVMICRSFVVLSSCPLLSMAMSSKKLKYLSDGAIVRIVQCIFIDHYVCAHDPIFDLSSDIPVRLTR